MSIDIAKASLYELGELGADPIIVGEIDDKLVALPTYIDLYHRWERQQWSTQDIDFSVDRQQWTEVDEASKPVWISGFVVFFQGEVTVTNTLIPYCAAMPTEAQRIFLTTQLVDEARHATFFGKFFREALQMDGPDIESILAQIRPMLRQGERDILLDGMSEIAQKIHDEPRNMHYLVEGVTLYHIITEGTLALAGQRNMLNRNKRLGWYPGFQQGFTAVARDESRHVLFGVRFLRDMVLQNPAYADVIRNTIARWMPQIHETLYLSEIQRTVLAAFDEDPDDIINFGMNSLRKKLKVIGVTHNF
jgi:ribonucleoside-diphosphate reductase beta chain